MSTSNIFSFFKFKNFFLLLSLLSFLFVSPLSAAEEAGSKVVLVLDASGSMWQKIGKKTKIEIAREVIGGIIKDWDPNAYLGLTAYGHRKKGDCKDIESLISVSKVNPGAFMKTINAINPKGKTPLTQAVLVAAKELKYSEEKATVILISDGKETCNADPCAVGNDLEKAGVDFTAHVVGFDVSDKIGMTQLQCLAKNTGGQFFAAKDASELKKALDIVVKKTAKGPNVKLTAIPKEGAKPFSEDVYWTVYPVGDDGKPAKKYVDSGFGDPKHFTLPAGRYLADVRVGKGKAKTEFEVTSDETTEKTVVVGVGYAQLTAIPKEGAEPFSEDVYWTVYPVGDDGKPAKKYVDSGFGDPKHFTLPAGRYLADVRVGKGKAKTEFEVTSDETTEKTVVVGVGYAQLTAIPKEGAEPFSEDVYWTVYPVGDDGKPAKKYVDSGFGDPKHFTLPAGRYLADVRVGKGKAKTEFEVTSDETTEKTVVVGVGYAQLTAIPKEGAEPFSEDVYWTVYPVGDDGKPAKKYVDSGFGDPKHFTLPAGRYLADVRVGKGKAKTELEVTSDETTEKTVVIGVGYAQLIAIPKEGAKPFSEDVYWTVYPVGDDGKPAKKYVDSGFGDPKHFTLPAGRYLADVRVGKGSSKTDFEVKAGETTKVVVVVKQP